MKRARIGLDLFVTGQLWLKQTEPIVISLTLAFPRLTLVVCFPALGTGCMFSRAWHRLHSFPRMAPVPFLSALITGYMFFPRLAPVACFRALGTGYFFFLRVAPVACFCVKFLLFHYDCCLCFVSVLLQVS